MKFIHIADVHANRERYDLVCRAFCKIEERIVKGDINFIVITGDFWDSVIQNTRASHFSDYVTMMKDLRLRIPVYMIYGTPFHEPAGSLEVFKCFGIEVSDYTPSMETVNIGGERLDIIYLPEPRLSTLDGYTAEEQEKSLLLERTTFLSVLPEKADKRIALLHGDIEGLKYQNGTPIPHTATSYSQEFLRKLNCDYIAAGHVHDNIKFEKNSGLNGGYVGSIAPINFGETLNAGFDVVEI